MAIEIYDKAKVIKKGNQVFYFLKYGSKNCYTLPYQTIVNAEFRNEFIRGQRRDSDWHIIASGTLEDHRQGKIAETYWNTSTGGVYGAIRFGNKKNIALYMAKQNPTDYALLDEEQQRNIDNSIRYYTELEGKNWCINLAEIPEHKRFKQVDTYCGRETPLSPENGLVYQGRTYWNLDNL